MSLHFCACFCNSKHKNIAGTFFIFLLFAIIVITWVYNIDLLPGLHGDEAMFGLQAAGFNEIGIEKPYSLNYYTGILFGSILSFVFESFGISITNLRLTGVLFNIAALIISGFIAKKINCIKAYMFFLLFICQSAIYMLYPRIAWEVTALNFLFLSIFLFSAVELFYKNRFSGFYIFIFLFAGLVGSYNHIIFLCIPVSASLAFILWSLASSNKKYRKLIPIGVISALNPVVLFFIMKYLIDGVWQKAGMWFFIFNILILAFESIFIWRINIKKTFGFRNFSDKRYFIFIKILGLFSVLYFIWQHGLAFWQVICNNVVYIRIFSFKPDISLMIIIYVFSSIIFLYFFYHIFLGLFKNKILGKEELITFIIAVFLGIFTFLIGRSSIRYYLLPILVCGFYMAYKLTLEKKKSVFFILPLLGLVIVGVLNIALIWSMYVSPDRPLSARHFRLGNNYIETSAHFLPLTLLIDTLKKKQIGNIATEADETYFIAQPVAFYKKMNPWDENSDSIATVKYDYLNVGSGFKIEIQKKQ